MQQAECCLVNAIHLRSSSNLSELRSLLALGFVSVESNRFRIRAIASQPNLPESQSWSFAPATAPFVQWPPYADIADK